MKTGARTDLIDAFRKVLLGPPRIAVFHSSLAKLALPPSVSKWDFLSVIDEFVKDGWTFAFPAFTFSFCGGKPFHLYESPSETGVLADWVLHYLPNAKRTHHPIYSFVVIGPHADAILACPSSTTFSEDSPFGLFERQNALMVMLGCGWEYCTQFHFYEEKKSVPYRFYKAFRGKAFYSPEKGWCDTEAKMYVRDLGVDPVNDFMSIPTCLEAGGKASRIPLWRGFIEAAQTSDISSVAHRYLQDNPWSFVSNKTQAFHRRSLIRERESQPTVKIAVLGSSNVDLLSQFLGQVLGNFLPERKTEIYTVPFGQLEQELLDPVSELTRFSLSIAFFPDRPEDILGQIILEISDRSMASELIRRRTAAIKHWAERSGALVVLNRFCVPEFAISCDNSVGEWIDEMNALRCSILPASPRTLWMSSSAFGEASDLRLSFAGRYPYSASMSERIAKTWVGYVLASLGKTARLIVLDLDNTLWGGVLGEDGPGGVLIGGDYPGNAFRAFQKALKVMNGRGVALAVCSKNDEKDALDAMGMLDGMAIRPVDLVTYRIGWEDKWKGIQEIADELNLGLASVLFIDDNPIEREAIRRNLPAVKVMDLPPAPEDYLPALLSSPWTAFVHATEEDKRRAESYKAMATVERNRREAVNLEDFYKSLDMTLTLRPLSEANSARAEQLCQKTNQFNTTTRRYDAPRLQALQSAGADVVVIALKDKYSEEENIGLLVLRPLEDDSKTGLIDLYLLSCRVLGRGFEALLVNWAQERANRRGWKTLMGEIVETDRNKPARKIFEKAGMTPDAQANFWSISTDTPCSLPDWLKLRDLL